MTSKSPKLISSKISWIYIVLFSVGGGFLFNYSLGKLPTKSSSASAELIPKDENSTGSTYSFINPTLLNGNVFHELLPFKNKIQSIVAQAKLQGKAKEISVYFRSMNDGYSFGINRKEKYYPASLLKVPLMMAYLKQTATIPGLMDKKIKFEKRFEGVPINEVPNKIELGKYYTIGELIEKMIVVSDNDATALLSHNIEPLAYKNTLKELGLNIPEQSSPDQNFMGIEDYARILRVLYNASYLNSKLSNHGLKLLSNAEFGDGLTAGINNKTVSHKYGEWKYQGEAQLHDCGIIYDGDQPYILCIMTKGKDSKVLAKVIAEISKTVAESLVNNTVPVLAN